MKISVGNSRMDKKWKNRDISWEDLCKKVSVTQRTTETVEEYCFSRCQLRCPLQSFPPQREKRQSGTTQIPRSVSHRLLRRCK